MKNKSFPGGIFPLHGSGEGKSATAGLPVELLPPPKEVVLPMSRATGAPSKCLVKQGDTVKMGQLIGEPTGFVGAPVHATVSGKVTAVENRSLPFGRTAQCVVIENDFQDTADEGACPYPALESMTPEDIRAAIRDMGIVGMGGATFPTHVKLSPPPGKTVDVLVVNGAECEPYITADHRLMIEQTEDVLDGIRWLMKAAGVSKAVVGIERNKPDALKAMDDAAGINSGIIMEAMRVKYPQGSEKQLIYALTRRVVPVGGLPADVGVVVVNVATAAAVSQAMRTGLPPYQRIVTVTGGGISRPANLRVRLGASFEDCIEACGGLCEDVDKLLAGGPMMGLAQYTTQIPVTAGTNGIVALSHKEAAVPEPSACICCGRCAEVCPMGLLPLSIAQASDASRYDEAEKLSVVQCVECGACSFVCPAKRHLVQSIRVAKQAVIQQAREKGGAAK